MLGLTRSKGRRRSSQRGIETSSVVRRHCIYLCHYDLSPAMWPASSFHFYAREALLNRRKKC